MTSGIRRAIRAGTTSALIAAALALPQGVARAQNSNLWRGEELAKRWCATCHVVDARGSGTAVDHAPPFPSMAGRSVDVLRGAITGPHVQMPEFNLGRRDVDDLIGYIRSLAKKP